MQAETLMQCDTLDAQRRQAAERLQSVRFKQSLLHAIIRGCNRRLAVLDNEAKSLLIDAWLHQHGWKQKTLSAMNLNDATALAASLSLDISKR